MTALALTAAGLIRALSVDRLQPKIDEAVRGEADRLATALARADVETRVERRAPGEYAVVLSGPSLFAREFGSLAEPPDRLVAETIRRLTDRVI